MTDFATLFRQSQARGRSGLPFLSAGDKAAPRIVCLHGFPDLPTSFSPIAERLVAAGFRVEAPFLPGYGIPGFGESPLPDKFSLEKVASRIEDFLAEGRRPTLVVGHDWGGLFAWFMQARRRIGFDAMATLSINHPALFLPAVLKYPQQLLRSLYVFGFQLPFVPEAVLRDRDALAHLYALWSPGLDLGPLEAHLNAVHGSLAHSAEGPLAYYRDILSLLKLPGRLALLDRNRVRVPALHFHGEQDGSIAPVAIRGQAEYFLDAYEEIRFPGAGHFLPLERPEPIAARLVELARAVGA